MKRISLAVALMALLTFAPSAFAAPGDLDGSFSADGSDVFDFEQDGFVESGLEAIERPDGMVLVGGTSIPTGNPGNPNQDSFDYPTVVLYGADGSRQAIGGDTDCGPIGAPFTCARRQVCINTGGVAHCDDSRTTAFARRPDGKLVLAGRVDFSHTGMPYNNDGTKRSFVMVLNADGTPDLTFKDDALSAVDGTRVFDEGAALDESYAALDLEGNDMVIAGWRNTTTARNILVRKITPAGAPVNTFGAGGLALGQDAQGLDNTVEDAQGVDVGPGGEVVVSGTAAATNLSTNNTRDIYAMRFDANGTPNNAFGTGGIAQANFDGGQDDTAFDMDTTANSLVIVGGTENGAANGMALLRLDRATGDPDTAFGGDGEVGFFPAGNATARAVDVATDESIYLGGVTGTDNFNGPRTATAHLSGAGTPDASWGTGGIATYDTSGTETISGIALDSAGRILFAGYADFHYLTGRVKSTFDPPAPPADPVVSPPKQQPQQQPQPQPQKDSKAPSAGGSFDTTVFDVTLDEPGTIAYKLKVTGKKGKKKKTVSIRSGRLNFTTPGKKTISLELSKKQKKALKKLKGKTLVLELTATDRAGNKSPKKTFSKKI